jgi:hypothetical protein
VSTRPQRDDDDQPNWRKPPKLIVQPPLDAKDRVTKMRETLAKTKTKTKEQR